MKDAPRTEHSPNWESILGLARVLRSPEGCPWDRQQTLAGLASYLVEEAHEVLHAAQTSTPDHMAEELGDTLFLLSLVQVAAEEAGGPDFASVAQGAIQKITRRHPHVFAEKQELSLPEAHRQWEQLKLREQVAAGSGAEGTGAQEPGAGGIQVRGQLPPPAPALPALLQAHRLQERAASTGFDWPDPGPVFGKVREELTELHGALETEGPAREGRILEEAGDLLFAVVNLCRQLGLDSEYALRQANLKFRSRFNRMVELASGEGRPLQGLSVQEMDAYWEEAKAEQHPPSGGRPGRA